MNGVCMNIVSSDQTICISYILETDKEVKQTIGRKSPNYEWQEDLIYY